MWNTQADRTHLSSQRIIAISANNNLLPGPHFAISFCFLFLTSCTLRTNNCMQFGNPTYLYHTLSSTFIIISAHTHGVRTQTSIAMESLRNYGFGISNVNKCHVDWWPNAHLYKSIGLAEHHVSKNSKKNQNLCIDFNGRLSIFFNVAFSSESMSKIAMGTLQAIVSDSLLLLFFSSHKFSPMTSQLSTMRCCLEIWHHCACRHPVLLWDSEFFWHFSYAIKL